MRILFIGDIFASTGRNLVAHHCQQLIGAHRIDLVIANAENAAGGFGLTPQIAEDLLSYGVDVLTTGNHVWDKRELYDYLPRQERLIRPANYAPGVPGRGLTVVKARNGVACAVLNLQGRVHMPPTDCPFRKADELLAELDPAVKIRFLDFHAEVTSEKIAMGWYLDGRVTAVVGTHTHVPTADTRVLPKGTAYQTDCGMTGPYDSVIGVEKDMILKRFQTSMPMKFQAAQGWPELHAVLIDADPATGQAHAIERLRVT